MAACKIKLSPRTLRLAQEIERQLDSVGLTAQDVLPVMRLHHVDAITAAVMVLEAQELIRLTGRN